jgi:hypothetical protein
MATVVVTGETSKNQTQKNPARLKWGQNGIRRLIGNASRKAENPNRAGRHQPSTRQALLWLGTAPSDRKRQTFPLVGGQRLSNSLAEGRGYLITVLFWIVYSGRSVAAQYGQAVHITKVTSANLIYGTVDVPGEIKGFSCASDVDGDLDKGNGNVSTQVNCYVLSK